MRIRATFGTLVVTTDIQSHQVLLLIIFISSSLPPLPQIPERIYVIGLNWRKWRETDSLDWSNRLYLMRKDHFPRSKIQVLLMEEQKKKEKRWQNNKIQKAVEKLTNGSLSLYASKDISPYCYSEFCMIC